MMEGGRERGAQAQMFGDPRHDRQDRHRIEVGELAAVVEIGVETALVDVRQAQSVGKEAAVEEARFQHLGKMLVALGHEDVAKLAGRMFPGAVMGRGWPVLT